MANTLIVLIICVFASVRSQQSRLLVEEDLALQVQKLTERLNKLEDCVKQRGVAFTAALGDHRTNLTLHEILRFDHVMTNEGNSFSGVTGTFTAPYAGVYVFDVTIGVGGSGSTDVYIVKNGVYLQRVYGHTTTNWETATASVTVHLNAEDHVFIKNANYNHGLIGHDLTTFSGFMVQPDCAL
ncbi:complement C1q-like protein 4 [Mytilus trossulus]|uniref:complement C1q-like protein 4 n=1 Tax=Mytilus trossulus TaxID=6551 RepID=UPI003003EC6A